LASDAGRGKARLVTDFYFEYRGEIFSFSCAFMWAGAVLLFRKSGDWISPIALNFFKGAVAILLLTLTLVIRRVPIISFQYGWVVPITLLTSGVIGIGIADSIFFASLNRLGAGLSAIVDCMYSPFVVLSAFLYLGEPIHLMLLVAMGLMASAILICSFEPVLVSSDPAARRRYLQGVYFGILSMMLMAIGIVLAKPALAVSDVWWASFVRMVGGEIFLGLQVIIRKQVAEVRSTFRPSRQWAVSVPSAVLGSYMAMVFWIAGMKYTLAGKASILNQTSTIFLPILAAIFLKEPLTWRKGVAVLLGFVGAIVVTL